MSVDIVKFGFTAGEISPKLWHRTDLEKYNLGIAQGINLYTDFKGGLLSRPGSKFCDYIYRDDLDVKLFKFQFAPNASKTYGLLFGFGYIRFIQSGQYILESGVNITSISQANPGVVTTSAPHGYSTGDWVKPFNMTGMTSLNAGTFQVGSTTSTTFQLLDHNGNAVNTASLPAQGASGAFYRVYTISSPYAVADLPNLRCEQSKSIIRITHNNYAPMTLTRISDTNWTLTGAVAGATLAAPTGVSIASSTAGTAGIAYAVTAIDINGIESVSSQYGFITVAVNMLTTSGSMSVTWNAVAGAVSYNVYRTIIVPVGTDISRAQQVGFVGQAFGTKFVDSNIVPDFTKTPPNYLNPFANGQIDFVTVTAGGTGYTNAATLSISGGGGSGFIGYPVVNAGGNIVGVVVVNGGSGYTSQPTITATVGSGATFTADLTPSSGNYPAVNAVYQQRQVYAATLNDPLSLKGSRSGQLDNFNLSSIVKDSDSLAFSLDSRNAAPIRHLLPTRFGLAIFSQLGLWHLGSDGGLAITPSSALADIQSSIGASNLRPQLLDTDIVFQEGKGSTIRMISYTAYTRVYTGQDLSILAGHLFKSSNPITNWDYAHDPHRIIHTVLSDGTIITLTAVKEQNVYAWTRTQTKGLYKDICVINEGSTDAVYRIVQRYINGSWSKFIEQDQTRFFPTIEDAWCVDAGLNLTPTYPAANLTASAASGNGVTFTADAAVFSAGNVGSIIRGNFGKAVIKSYISTTQVTADITIPMTLTVPQDPSNMPLPMTNGNWTMDAPISSVSGLGHLEGQLVSILGDGSVHTQQTVTNGSVPLDTPCTRVVIGLPYTCTFQSLPPDINGGALMGKRQQVAGLAVRFHETRGLTFGEKLSHMYPMKERTFELMGEAGNLINDIRSMAFPGSFNEFGQFYLQQTYPLPMSILGTVANVEVGDDSPANKQQ